MSAAKRAAVRERLSALYAAYDEAHELDRLCEVMHNAYEEAAAEQGWETQERSRKPWSEVPEANKRTMRVAVRALLAELVAAEPTDQGETRTEWGVRRNHGDVGSVAGPYSQRQTEVMAKAWDGTVVSREVTTGPWVEVSS